MGATDQAPSGVRLETFAGLFEALAREGLSAVVIGGCAVGVYARRVEAAVLSQDLDLYMTESGLEALLGASTPLGLVVEKRPRPRSLPVAVLRWQGLEVNVLTATHGLPPAEVVMRAAREVVLGDMTEPILIADAADLLRNKLAVNREKDRPHIELLRRFLDEEVVHAFRTERAPRARLAPADRLLAVLGAKTLDAELGARLVGLAQTATDFRFLAHRLPTRALVEALAARAPSTDLRALVEAVAEARNLA